ncbi:hypothetical protein BJV82DRAFT_640847 [Fennellomyces sp. T-0311]|nr:hypothetical protein BJV82DRAFT_640847 [Fennellomyces sp. T-0311]
MGQNMSSNNNNNNSSDLHGSQMLRAMANMSSEIQRLTDENRQLTATLVEHGSRIRALSRAPGTQPVADEPTTAEPAVVVSAPRRYTKEEVLDIRNHVHARVKQLAACVEEPLTFNFDLDFAAAGRDRICTEQTGGQVDDPKYVKDALLAYFNTLKRAYRLSAAGYEEMLQRNRRRARVAMKIEAREAAYADHKIALESAYPDGLSVLVSECTSEEESDKEGDADILHIRIPGFRKPSYLTKLDAMVKAKRQRHRSSAVAGSSSSTGGDQQVVAAAGVTTVGGRGRSGRGSQSGKRFVRKYEVDDSRVLDPAVLARLPPWAKN